MMTRYVTLLQRIRQEMVDIDACVSIIERHWAMVDQTRPDNSAYVNSVAFNLHSFYAGVERIFELIATELDGGTVGGEAWHNNLLRQMAVEIPEVRPAVLSAETAESLAEYLRFRHLVRNIYAFRLDVTRMAHLAQEIGEVWANLRQELNQFVDYLQALSRADEIE